MTKRTRRTKQTRRRRRIVKTLSLLLLRHPREKKGTKEASQEKGHPREITILMVKEVIIMVIHPRVVHHLACATDI